MGGIFKKPSPPPRNDALERQMAADRAAEEKRQRDMERESKAYATKKAKGIIGARSLFARAGGRGFFG
jgi:hypothetical protein|tara:strand:+ start:6414 stop:6617 length:204 start_codon:yes stop_codon:yes gene_type:complete